MKLVPNMDEIMKSFIRDFSVRITYETRKTYQAAF